ncbi:hypothetical protein NOR_07273 [Metarhizium rileyi]|uniref:Uncharacterized protein n=1 Tax=Metarhizium rileyi (strain RCEF 4871) TaxID=1649241 RepID=A0A166YKA0_METRR|nr:hypothetical protein NOR_07273 [Metarhizium rileyi RCEF 4871]
MDVKQALRTPRGELAFIYPRDIPRDRHDWRYGTIRSELGHRADWLPRLHPWDRFAASELSIADFYKKTLISRVNAGLKAAASGLHIVGTPKHFPSYGTYDNRTEGDSEKLVAPDLVALDADILNEEFVYPPDLQNLAANIVAIGEIKQKNVELTDDESVLPGTLGCYESWLAQPIQSCLDLKISLGFLLTNVELVLFHLIKLPSQNSQTNRMTLRSKQIPALDALPSDATQELVFSSPAVRQRKDWINFHDGDSDIPDVSNPDTTGKQWTTPVKSSQVLLHTPRTPLRSSLPSSPFPQRKRPRTSTLQVTGDSQASIQPPSTPCPDPRVEHEQHGISDLPSSSQIGTVSPSEFEIDQRGEDPSYILIRSYKTTDNDEVAERLFEHIVLAKRAKDFGLLQMGHYKLSHAALDQFEAD